jgi:GNAT superfamily N-acetyltransferase
VAEPLQLRQATPGDVPALLALYDERVAWLVAQGRTGQWGSEPISSQPTWRSLVEARVGSGNTVLANDSTGLVGALVLGDRPPFYVEHADEPEFYLGGFITALPSTAQAIQPAARSVGSVLWQHVYDTARVAGVALLRLDCYAGGDRALVRYYEGRGFQAVRELTVQFPGAPEPYHGCLLARRLPAVYPAGLGAGRSVPPGK